MKLRFDNWQINEVPEAPQAHQYDNRTQLIQVVGELPAGYSWTLGVSVMSDGGELQDVIPLQAVEGGVESDPLTAGQLSVAGYYRVQLRGHLRDDPIVLRHTNTVTVYVAESVVGDDNWPDLPAEFMKVEAQLTKLKTDTEGAAEGAVKAAGTAGNAAKKAAEAAERAEAAVSGKTLVPGHAVKYDRETGTLSVMVANAPEADNTLPITAAAVETTVGNIEVLLKTI